MLRRVSDSYATDKANQVNWLPQQGDARKKGGEDLSAFLAAQGRRAWLETSLNNTIAPGGRFGVVRKFFCADANSIFSKPLRALY